MKQRKTNDLRKADKSRERGDLFRVAMKTEVIQSDDFLLTNLSFQLGILKSKVFEYVNMFLCNLIPSAGSHVESKGENYYLKSFRVSSNEGRVERSEWR